MACAYSGGQIKCALPFSERSPRRVLDELCGPQKLHRTVARHGKPPSAYQLCEGVLLMLTKCVRMCHMALHALTYCTPHISQYICSFRVKLRISGFFVSVYRSVREPDFFDDDQRPLRRSFRKRQRAIDLAATVPQKSSRLRCSEQNTTKDVVNQSIQSRRARQPLYADLLEAGLVSVNSQASRRGKYYWFAGSSLVWFPVMSCTLMLELAYLPLSNHEIAARPPHRDVEETRPKVRR